MGRPSSYTPEIADEICERLAGGESLRSICGEDRFPSEVSVRRWVIADIHGFAAQYAHARDLGLDALADEVMAIADDGSADYVVRKNEKGQEYEVVDQEHIARSRLRFDARRWYLSKLAPKKYGERQQLEHSGGDKPLEVIVRSVLRPKDGGSHE